MRSLDPLSGLAAGAIGPPGQRRFFVAADSEGTAYWFLMEKQQVASLADRLSQLLRDSDYEVGTAAPADLGAVEPDDIEFRVGEMAVGLMPDSRSVVITLFPVENEEAESVNFEASFDQIDGMTQAAFNAVASGRPACPRCNLPMDPEGHTCPASNGDLRHQRS